MLITICYSVLTWIQSRQRTEISSWLHECCSKEKGSIVFVRDRILYVSDDSSCLAAGSTASNSFGVSRSESSYSFGESPSRNISRSNSVSVSNSNFSSPRRDYLSEQHLQNNVCQNSSDNISGPPSTKSWSGSTRQISDLCYNHNAVRKRKLLWEEDRTRALVLFPYQTVELHDWTAFRGTKVQGTGLTSNDEEANMFYILLEAEPGSTFKHQYRKFHQFGHITAWKCGAELALILLSDTDQIIELMHIFRLGQIILEGGWRVYRLTTIHCEGTVGTQISRSEILNTQTALTPGDLRRLSTGIYENREYQTSTPKTNISHDASKHDITTINEESFEESEIDIVKKLPNWYERSPKKRSIATIPAADKPSLGRRRVSSFCSGSLSNLSHRSSSLASLLMCSKSMSVEEEEGTDTFTCVQQSELFLPQIKKPSTLVKSGGQSHESLSSTSTENALSRLQSPTTNLAKPITVSPLSLSLSATPKKGGVKMGKKSPSRLGKPPNILVLCDGDQRREEIANVLKTMLANDRYVIYDIRWDQLVVGGWSDQTALLVVSGKIPEESHVSLLLQFLGDGGKLLAWCCETHPFGPMGKPSSATPTKLTLEKSKRIIQYGATQRITHPLFVSNSTWGVAPESKDNHPPADFQRILESNDSEGYSRPLAVSVFGKVKGTNETAIIQLDGGALGGKAILSQVHFQSSMDDESCLALLSVILSQNLGIDCTQIKTPEYSLGYLLGDHKKIMDFLSITPSTVQQSELTVEFIPRGEKGSLPSHLRLPVKYFECPPNFSTLDYFDNITSKDLGRLVIYADVITTVLNVLNGHPLQHGLVVIAKRQTAGKGRGKNVWLSPEGCACFAVQLIVNLDSQMGRRLSLLQHIGALAVILSVPNHKEMNLRVKWPNDIYLDDQKVGGIRVDTRVEGKNAVVNLGIGVNVSNDYPTACLNSHLHPESNSKGNVKKEKPLSVEKVIATTLSELEKLLKSIETEPIDKFLNLYAENWIHDMEDGGTVNVEVSEGCFTECSVLGIDEFGFLRVTEVESGHVFSVRPDGNSFDIANRLIAIKD